MNPLSYIRLDGHPVEALFRNLIRTEELLLHGPQLTSERFRTELIRPSEQILFGGPALKVLHEEESAGVVAEPSEIVEAARALVDGIGIITD